MRMSSSPRWYLFLQSFLSPVLTEFMSKE
uniref:Uncharacterized protein n=1 Tax=Arundo donax TaxID=35708 RepID=A0A0A9FU26_ARUDO